MLLCTAHIDFYVHFGDDTDDANIGHKTLTIPRNYTWSKRVIL